MTVPEVLLPLDESTSLLSKPQSDTPGKIDTQPPQNHRLGTALVVCSCLLFSGMHTSVRYAAEKLSFDPVFLAVFRGVAQLTLVTTLILSYGVRRIIPEQRGKALIFLLLRGLLGSVAMFSKYEALSRLPVGVAVSLFSTTPIFAALFAFIFVSESLALSDILSMAVCLSGAVLVGTSDGPLKLDGHILGVALALGAASITGMVFVLIRALGTRVHFFFSVQALGVGASLTPFFIRVLQTGDVKGTWEFILSSFQKVFASSEATIAVFSIGLFSFAAAMCLNRALQLVGAGNAATTRTLDIPINFLTGFFVLGEVPHTGAQVLGCALITIGVYVNVANKAKP